MHSYEIYVYVSCLCSGLYYLRPSVEGLAFVHKWVASRDTEDAWDQQRYNHLLYQQPPILKYVNIHSLQKLLHFISQIIRTDAFATISFKKHSSLQFCLYCVYCDNGCTRRICFQITHGTGRPFSCASPGQHPLMCGKVFVSFIHDTYILCRWAVLADRQFADLCTYSSSKDALLGNPACMLDPNAFAEKFVEHTTAIDSWSTVSL